jgi:hypothetical protein
VSDRLELVIVDRETREEAMRLLRTVRPGSRVEFKGPLRTLDQNAKVRAMLGEIAEQATWQGRTLTPGEWKNLFTAGAMMASGENGDPVQALDGGAIVLLGRKTSDLSVIEASDLITYMVKWCDENGVVLRDPKNEKRTA